MYASGTLAVAMWQRHQRALYKLITIGGMESILVWFVHDKR
jgi:hypothetical protein